MMTSAEICTAVQTAITQARNPNLTFDGQYDPTDRRRVFFGQRSPSGQVTVHPVDRPDRPTRFFTDGELYSSVLIIACELRGAESQAEEDPAAILQAARDFACRFVSVLG